MFEFVSMAPFGGPVVPLVYTKVARSSGFTAETCASKSLGFAALYASPSASSCAHVVTKSPVFTSVGSTTIALRNPGSSWRTCAIFASCAAFSRTIAFASECPVMYATWGGEFVA